MIVGAVPLPHADGCRCRECARWGDGSDVEALRQKLYRDTQTAELYQDQ